MVLIRKIRTFFKIYRERNYRKKLRKQLRNDNFCIICNNCWGGGLYEDFNLPYNTPTVGLFFYGPCYISFLENFEENLNAKIEFSQNSKYEMATKSREKLGYNYPIGILKNDVEVHFLHYKTEIEAEQKWERRKKRIDIANLFVVFVENDLVTQKEMATFEKLEFKNKLILSSKNYPHFKSLVFLPKTKGQPNVGDLYTNKELWRNDFNVLKWLNES